MRARRVTGVAALLATVGMLSACFLAPAPAPSATPDTNGVAADLLPFYGQTLEWETCEGGSFDCTTVRVPRDWDDPSAGEIDLAVIRHRAAGGEPLGSLLTNPGGPGVSGYDYVRASLFGIAGDPVTQAYDVIGFDPRGVARSSPVECLDAAGMDGYLYDIPAGDRGTPEREDAELEIAGVFVDACAEHSGDLLPHLSTDDAARDLDLLRGVLGDTELNYLGRSWGTALGTAYARLFPERVGRVVLDGAMDPSIPGADTGATQAIGFEASLRVFAEDCASSGECPYAGDQDDVLGDIGGLLARLDARPIAAGDGRLLGADTLLTAITQNLYVPAGWPALRALLAGAENGEADAALASADAYNRRVGDGYLFNTTEAFTAYNCRDYPPDSDEVQDAAYERVLRLAPVTGQYWFGADACSLWPAESTAVREPVTAAGAAPILVVGTTGDPATPYEWAVSLADQLESGVLVTRVGEGHTGYLQGDDCVDAAVEAYLVDGTVPASDIRCE